MLETTTLCLSTVHNTTACFNFKRCDDPVYLPVCLLVCLSVCMFLSHSWSVSKRLNTPSKTFYYSTRTWRQNTDALQSATGRCVEGLTVYVTAQDRCLSQFRHVIILAGPILTNVVAASTTDRRGPSRRWRSQTNYSPFVIVNSLRHQSRPQLSRVVTVRMFFVFTSGYPKDQPEARAYRATQGTQEATNSQMGLARQSYSIFLFDAVLRHATSRLAIV